MAQVKPSNRPSTKVVVRLLPPTLTEEAFIRSIGDDVLPNTSWLYFVPGKRRRTSARPSTNSRAYINLLTPQLAESFCKTFHGHSFIDEKGEVFRAVVCLAPYQKVPRFNVAKDKKANTMESDPLYLQFMQSLSEQKQTIPHPTETLLDTIAPLVKAVKEKRRVKEEQAAKSAERKRQARARANAREAKTTKKSQVVIIQKPERLNEKPKKASKPKKESRIERKKCRGKRKEVVEEKKIKKIATEQTAPVAPVQKILERPAKPVQLLQRQPTDSHQTLGSQSSTTQFSASMSSKPTRPIYVPKGRKSSRHSEEDEQRRGPRGGRGRKEQVIWRPTILKNDTSNKVSKPQNFG